MERAEKFLSPDLNLVHVSNQPLFSKTYLVLVMGMNWRLSVKACHFNTVVNMQLYFLPAISFTIITIIIIIIIIIMFLWTFAV